MRIEEEDVLQALELAKTNKWPKGIPVVRARVRLAINSLIARDKDIFHKDAAEVTKILRKRHNAGIRRILKNTSVESFAFGIYSALN